MYRFLARRLGRPAANGITLVWYALLMLLCIYVSSHGAVGFNYLHF